MMKRLLLDVDGVSADFIELYQRFLLATCGIKTKPEDVTQWDTAKALGLTKLQKATVFQMLSGPGAAFEMKPYPGAVEAIKELSTIAHVYFVTSPLGSLTWTYDREAWLKLHFGDELGKRVTHTHDKHICGGDIFVDDKPEHIDSWMSDPRNKFGIPVLWDRPYNQSYSEPDSVIRTGDWEVVKGLVLYGRQKEGH